MLEEYSDDVGFNIAAGGSMLVNPAGIVKGGPVLNEEALITTIFDRNVRRATKAYFDALGHYSRCDAVNLKMDSSSVDPVHQTDSHNDISELSTSEIDEMVEEYDISPDSVKDIADALLSD